MKQRIALAILIMFLFAGCNNKTQQPQQELAIMKIANYAQDNETPPSLQEYIDAGVNGVTADNLNDINAFILDLKYEDVDTLEEIQAIINQLNLSLEEPTTVEENKPSSTPQPTQGPQPSSEPVEEPTVQPTVEPTPEPTEQPSSEPTQTPVEVVATPTPTTSPIVTPTVTPTPTPIATPTPTPEPNNAPVVDAGSDKSVELGQSVTLSATATDSDGDTISYKWSENTNLLANTLSFEYTPNSEGNHTLTFMATDENNASSSDSVTVEVTEECDPLSQFVGAC